MHVLIFSKIEPKQLQGTAPKWFPASKHRKRSVTVRRRVLTTTLPLALMIPSLQAVAATSDAKIDVRAARTSAITQAFRPGIRLFAEGFVPGIQMPHKPAFELDVTIPVLYNTNPSQISPASNPSWEANPEVLLKGEYHLDNLPINLQGAIETDVDRYTANSSANGDKASGLFKAIYDRERD